MYSPKNKNNVNAVKTDPFTSFTLDGSKLLEENGIGKVSLICLSKYANTAIIEMFVHKLASFLKLLLVLSSFINIFSTF